MARVFAGLGVALPRYWPYFGLDPVIPRDGLDPLPLSCARSGGIAAVPAYFVLYVAWRRTVPPRACLQLPADEI